MIITGHNVDPSVARTIELAVEALNRDPHSRVVIAVIPPNKSELFLKSSSGRATDWINTAHACLEEIVEAKGGCDCAPCQRARSSATFMLMCLGKGGHA